MTVPPHGVPASRRGLALHPGAPEFLARAYGARLEGWERGMPLYAREGRLFWGGWGSFYTVCFGEDVGELRTEAERVGRSRGAIEACFSVPQWGGRTRHVNPVLELPAGMRTENRLELYARNIKKHVRNTIARESVRYAIEGLPAEWSDLHLRATAARERASHPPEYFRALEQSFGKDVVAVAARDGGALIGGLACLRVGDYLHLLSIAADAAYRPARVDSGLYDAAVSYALGYGIRFVDFGLTDARNESLLAYKRAFGAEPWKIVDRTFGAPLGRLGAFAGRVARALRRRLAQ